MRFVTLVKLAPLCSRLRTPRFSVGSPSSQEPLSSGQTRVVGHLLTSEVPAAHSTCFSAFWVLVLPAPHSAPQSRGAAP